jgi:hypothetical protein
VEAAAVRVGHRAWFRRRRPETPAPRALDIVQVCCGLPFAHAVHARASRKLADVDALEDTLLLTCCDYYAQQKHGFAWMATCCRLGSGVDVPALAAGGAGVGASPVLLVQLPVRGAFGVVRGGTLEACPSLAQALLHWMHAVCTDAGGRVGGVDLRPWMDRCGVAVDRPADQ